MWSFFLEKNGRESRFGAQVLRIVMGLMSEARRFGLAQAWLYFARPARLKM
jgi:hypothetical protein